MNYKNIVNFCSGLFICVVAFTAIAISAEEEMNPLKLEDLFKFNTITDRVPIDITPDGNWVAYTTQNREQYEGGGGDSIYSKTGVVTLEVGYATVWVTNTQTGEHRNLTPNWGSSWAPRWSPDGTRLAFFSDRMGKPHLFIWNRESDDIQECLSTTVRTFFGFEVPKWTPDGRYVLFKSISSIDDESGSDVPKVSPKTPQESSFVEIWDWPKKRLQEQKSETVEEDQTGMTNPFGKQDIDLTIADTKTGKTFSLMKEYMVRSFDIAPNGKHVAVIVYLGSETPAAQQPVFALYVLPMSKELNETSSTEIEPFVRKIRMGYGITVSWSPDSRYLAYTTEGDLAAGDAFVVDVETGIVRNLTENLDVDLGQEYKPPLWIGESEALLCIARGKIWKVPLNGGAIQNLTENYEFSVHNVFYPSEGYAAWTVDNAIAITVYDHKQSCHSFYRLSLRNNTVTPLREESKHRLVHAGRFFQDVAEETGEFIYVVESNREPQNIWVSDAAFESSRQITDVNPHLQTIDFGRSELVEWTLKDSQTVKGILVLPPKASEEKPAPMIVNVYAGSMPSHYINQFSFANSVGYFHTGMFVSRGYAVFLPDFPVQEIEPYKQFSEVILPGIDAAIATEKVDAERLGVIGHSFGGYTVNVLITQTTRFKAAVAIASKGNLISGYLNGDNGLGTGWYEAGQAGMGGSLWEFPQRYIDGSPVFHLDKVETPLLLIHGDQDFIPFEQAKEVFMGLARLEKEVVLLKYKEADHAPDFWSNEKLADYWERILSWYDEYLK